MTICVQAATKFLWRVSWVADSGQNCGMTVRGKTGWRRSPGTSSYSVFVDVDTSASGFLDSDKFLVPPRYFPALHGDRKHWATRGVHITSVCRAVVL